MNMTLDGLERILKERFPMRRTVAGKTVYDQINFVRYADDFIVTGKSPETLRNEVIPLIKDFLAERGLQLSEEKRQSHISATVLIFLDRTFGNTTENCSLSRQRMR